MKDPYAIRQEAERIIGEDRVPTDVLEALLSYYGDDEARKLTGSDVLSLFGPSCVVCPSCNAEVDTRIARRL